VLTDVETFVLDFLADPETGDQLGDEDGDGSTNRSPDQRNHDSLDLDPHLGAHVDRTVTRTTEARLVDDAGDDGADDAANAVDAESVERVVVTKSRLNLRDEDEADDRGNGAEDDRTEPLGAWIDPAAIMPILPDLYILERLADNGLRFRLVGTAVRDLFRHDVTGKRLDEALDGEYYRNAVRCYRLVNATRTPWLTRIVYDLGQGDRFTYRRLVCPLSADGEQPDSYVGAFETTDIYSPARLFIEVEHMVTAILERREAVLEAGWLG